jgi:FolB domain-containing protein
MENQASIIITDLVLPMHIGVYAEEHDAPQKVKINIKLIINDLAPWTDAKYAETICYHKLIMAIEKFAGSGHFNLVETVAEKIAGLCMDWPQARQASVRVEKLETDNPVNGVGVELIRQRKELLS